MKSTLRSCHALKTFLQFLSVVVLIPWMAHGQACPSGFFSATGSSPCSPCPAGQSQPETGQTSCIPCAAGFYQEFLGAPSCIACAGGTANPATGSSLSSACSPCTAGTFSEAGAGSCTSCAAGSINTADGSTSCTLCAVGSYQPGTGQTSCLACPTGSYQSEAGAANCTACSPGTFNSVTGSASSSACLSCAAGSFQPDSGKDSCALCGLGTYQSATGQASCIACAAGTYTFTTGNIACKRCSSRSSEVVVVLTSLNKTGRTTGKIEGIFSSSNPAAAAIRPDLNGLKIVLENGQRTPIFTALLPAGANWSSTKKTIWRFRDQSASTGISAATIRLRKVGPRTELVVALSVKKGTIALTKAELPIYLNVGFGANGTAPCSQTRVKTKNCTMPRSNSQLTCNP